VPDIMRFVVDVVFLPTGRSFVPRHSHQYVGATIGRRVR
jgi:hypothetical protein